MDTSLPEQQQQQKQQADGSHSEMLFFFSLSAKASVCTSELRFTCDSRLYFQEVSVHFGRTYGLFMALTQRAEINAKSWLTYDVIAFGNITHDSFSLEVGIMWLLIPPPCNNQNCKIPIHVDLQCKHSPLECNRNP